MKWHQDSRGHVWLRETVKSAQRDRKHIDLSTSLSETLIGIVLEDPAKVEPRKPLLRHWS